MYELLTGSTPFDRQRFAEAAYDEIRRIIKEEEPPKPSTRLSSLGATLTKVSQQRKTEPAKLSALVKGDLDWIVMKALEKDRNRRYETASAFAADVRRFLADEPVEACPPSRRYLLRKFIRRHKRIIVSAAIFMLLMIDGTTISVWQAVRADQADQRAQLERDGAEAALGFIHDLIFTPAMAGEMDLSKALDRASKRIDSRFGQQPIAEARVRLTLGEAYSWLGDPEQAEPQLVRVREICLREYGPDHRNTLIAQWWLVNAYIQRDQRKLDLAEPLAHDGLARARRSLGEDDSLTNRYRREVGAVLHNRGQLREAESMLAAAIEGFGREPREVSAWELAATRYELAMIRLAEGRWQEAEVHLRAVEKQNRKELGPEDLAVGNILADLGWALLEQKKFGDAEGVLRECLAIREKKKPGELRHHKAQSLLGDALASQRKFVEAEKLLLAAEVGLLKVDSTDKIDKDGYAKRVREFRGRLVRLYEAWERPKEAAEWRNKLEILGGLQSQ